MHNGSQRFDTENSEYEVHLFFYNQAPRQDDGRPPQEMCAKGRANVAEVHEALHVAKVCLERGVYIIANWYFPTSWILLTSLPDELDNIDNAMDELCGEGSREPTAVIIGCDSKRHFEQRHMELEDRAGRDE